MIWYRCTGNEEIEEVEVLKESKQMLLIRIKLYPQHWVKKLSRSEIYFPTKEEAVAFWLKKINQDIAYHQSGVEYAKEKLEKYKKIWGLK